MEISRRDFLVVRDGGCRRKCGRRCRRRCSAAGPACPGSRGPVAPWVQPGGPSAEVRARLSPTVTCWTRARSCGASVTSESNTGRSRPSRPASPPTARCSGSMPAESSSPPVSSTSTPTSVLISASGCRPTSSSRSPARPPRSPTTAPAMTRSERVQSSERALFREFMASLRGERDSQTGRKNRIGDKRDAVRLEAGCDDPNDMSARCEREGMSHQLRR